MTRGTVRQFSVSFLVYSFACGVLTTLLTNYLWIGSKSIPNELDGNIVLAKVNDPTLGDRFIGSWIVERTDSQQADKETVHFSENGTFDDHAIDTFGKQWFCTDGILYIVTRPNDTGNDKSHMTPLIPVFDESGTVATLSNTDGSPRLKMSKMNSGRG